MKKELKKISKFLHVRSIAESNGIEILISGNVIIIQKEHTLYKARSVNECSGFLFGYLEGIGKKFY